jgi:DNA-binding NtrC family response regulator
VSGKILVVDDHAELAENLAEILHGSGHEAVVAHSAEAALERVMAGDITAIITDFRLPGRSGADLIAELRERKIDVPALVMSAYTDDATIASAEEAGALEVMAKPINIGRLMSMVQALGASKSLILVVDDNRSLAENLAEALGSRGYDVRVRTTAAEALAERGRIGVAILDYRLPDASGVQVAERLRARDPRVRILFVSGHGAELKAQLGAQPGSRLAESETMDKPIDVGQLISWVSRAMDHGQADRPRR